MRALVHDGEAMSPVMRAVRLRLSVLDRALGRAGRPLPLSWKQAHGTGPVELVAAQLDGHPITAGRRIGTISKARTISPPEVNGLITHIDGMPVQHYLRALVADRALAFEQIIRNPKDKSMTRGDSKAYSVTMDLRTGDLYEATNGTARAVLKADDVHPLMGERLAEMVDGGPYLHYTFDGEPFFTRTGERSTGDYLWADDPLRHAELKSTNRALWYRTGPLGGFLTEVRFIGDPQKASIPGPTCPNGTFMTEGTLMTTPHLLLGLPELPAEAPMGSGAPAGPPMSPGRPSRR
jgi:hypothetical protein